jgi:hypothetical protein
MTLRNRATPEGRELGQHVARLVDADEARARERFPDLPPRCASCACRAGPHVANGSPETLMDFLKCITEGREFYCHEPAREGMLCSGWAIVMLAKAEADFREAPWGWSQEAEA